MVIKAQVYIFEGLDEQVCLQKAMKDSSQDGPVMVHYHKSKESCEGLKHIIYVAGIPGDGTPWLD